MIRPGVFHCAEMLHSRFLRARSCFFSPFLLGPLGILLARTLDFQIPNFAFHIFPILPVVGLTAYYLMWKYLVGFLNRVVNLA